MAYWIFLIAVFVGTLFFFIKYSALQNKRIKPSEVLEKILFPSGNAQKKGVIEEFKKITSQNFSDDEIIDFFLKEKGLQLISINIDFSPSVKKFIFKPTMIDLNYFERVKFHEMFLNYPKVFKKR